MSLLITDHIHLKIRKLYPSLKLKSLNQQYGCQLTSCGYSSGLQWCGLERGFYNKNKYVESVLALLGIQITKLSKGSPGQARFITRGYLYLVFVFPQGIFGNETTNSSCKTSQSKMFTFFTNKLIHEVRRAPKNTNFRDRTFVKGFSVLIAKPHAFKVLQLFYVYRNLLQMHPVFLRIMCIRKYPSSSSLPSVCFFFLFLRVQYLSKVLGTPSVVCTEWLQELFLENGGLSKHPRMKDARQNFKNTAFGEFLKPPPLPNLLPLWSQ